MAGDEAREIGIDRDRQGAAFQHLLLGFGGDQALFKGAVSATADDPNVPRTQPVAQLGEYAELVIAPVDRTAGQDVPGPSLADEAGRDGFRQLEYRGFVHLAQRIDGAQQRGGGRHALEGEGREKGRRPASHAGVVRAQHLVGIELFRTRQRLRRGDAGAEALPRDHCRDRIEGVLPALARGNQRGADAGVETDLLVNGTAIGLEGPGMPVLGLAEHGSDEPVEQIDSLIRQDGAQIERHGYQGRMTALTFVSSDMLCRGASGLAGKLGKARLGYAMPARGIDANCANVV
jgi:hypothetical protein